MNVNGGTIKLKSSVYEFTNSEFPDLKLYVDRESGYWLFVERKYWSMIEKFKTGVKKEVLEKQDLEFLNTLHKYHLLDSDNINTQSTVYEKFGLLILHFADGCNLNCKYCFVKAPTGKNKIMPETLALRAIENMIKTTDRFTLEFNAGEPLLYLDFIEQIVAKTRQQYPDKKIRFSIQTNGTLINEKAIRFIKEHDIRISVSVDGPQEVHDKFRVFRNGKGSFILTMRGLEKLRDAGISFGIVSVITTPDDLLKAFDFFVNEGIKYVKFNVLFLRVRDKVSKEIELIDLAKAHCEIFEKALYYYKNAKYIFLSNIIAMLKNIIFPFKTYMCMKSPCGAMRNQIAIDWNGDIYPCHRFVGLKDFIIGHVNDFRDYRALPLSKPHLKQLWERRVENISKCKNCPWRSFCGGGCAAATWAKFNDLFRESDLCEYYKYLFNCLIWKIYKYKDLIPDYINQKEVV